MPDFESEYKNDYDLRLVFELILEHPICTQLVNEINQALNFMKTIKVKWAKLQDLR